MSMHRLTRSARGAARALAITSALAVTALTAGVAGAQSLPGALVFSAPGGAIGDNRTSTFSIVVDAAGTHSASRGVTVRFRDFVDAAAGDLYAELTYTPFGAGQATRSALLFGFAPDGYFGQRAFDGTYSFGTRFTTALPGGVVRSGDFAAPGDLLGMLDGQAIAGTYQIHVVDWYSNGGASIGGIDLAFDAPVSTVPEPASVALLAAGVVVLGAGTVGRRRAGA